MAQEDADRHDRGQASPDGKPLAKVVDRNINKLVEMGRRSEQRKTVHQRIADTITGITGSMPFAYGHIIAIIAWVVVNLGWLGITPFDPFPFGLLTMIGSLEALVLTTFVLISQNRQMATADRRADLDLQINLLAEHEVTRILAFVDAIAVRLGVEPHPDKELPELKQDVQPDELLEKIDQHRQQAKGDAPLA